MGSGRGDGGNRAGRVEEGKERDKGREIENKCNQLKTMIIGGFSEHNLKTSQGTYPSFLY